MEVKKRSVLGMANAAFTVVIVGKVLGLIKQMVISSSFGTSLETDIINLSSDSVFTIQYIFSQMIFSAYVVVYLKASREDVQREKRFLRDSIILFSFVGIIISCLIVLLPPIISKVLAPSYTLQNSQRLSTYLRIFAILLTPTIFISFFEAILNANEQFVKRELATSVQNVSIILFVLLWGASLGITGLVMSHFVNVIIVLCYLFLCVISYFRKITEEKIYLPWKSEDIRCLISMMVPMLISYSMVYLNQYVDKMLASGMDSGSVSALGYGSSISNLIIGLFTSIIGVLYTRSSKLINEKENRKAEELVFSFSSLLCFLAIPASIVFFLCSDDLVSILFMRGAFNEKSVEMTASALRGYSLCFVPYIIKNIFSKYQYTFQKAKRPMIYGTIGIVFNIILSIVLGKKIGIIGIALASSIAEVLVSLLNFISAIKLNLYIPVKKYGCRLLRILLSLMPTILISNIIYKYTMGMSSHLRVIIMSLAVFSAFLVLNIKLVVSDIRIIRKL